MPELHQINLRNPSYLQAALNWRFAGHLDFGAETTGIHGSLLRRGTVFVGAGRRLVRVMFRGGSITSPYNSGLAVSGNTFVDATSYLNTLCRFNETTIFPTKTTGTITYTHVSSAHYYTSFLWVLGKSSVSIPRIMALPYGAAIPTASSDNWLAPPPGHSVTVGEALALRRAGNFYYYLVNNNTGGTASICRASGATATSTGFTAITTTPIPSFEVVNYEIDDTGTVQMVGTSFGATYRSLDGGVTWAVMALSLTPSPYVEIQYSSMFNRWIMGSDADGEEQYYSDDSGATWTTCRVLDANLPTSATTAVGLSFNVIEKVDPEGQIMLGMYGTPPQVFISRNGGRLWQFLTSLTAPFFDQSDYPFTDNDSNPNPVSLLNDGSRIHVYYPGVNDPAVFASDAYAIPAYGATNPVDPRMWLP
jgi:hypothetical protein